MDQIPSFEALQTSTSTVMIYTNLFFFAEKIFPCIPITKIDAPRTKKQKNVDKKRIKAPYGAIISVQYRNMIRGLDTRKQATHWCTVCQPIMARNGKDVKVHTVTEYLVPRKGTDISDVMYYCRRCDKSYHPSELKKINHFLNQITFVLSVGTQPILNVMMFNDNLKIAGCKDPEDAMEAIAILHQDFLLPLSVGVPPKSKSLKAKGSNDLEEPHSVRKSDSAGKEPREPGWRIKTREEGNEYPDQARYAFEVVMRNVGFNLGFLILREQLNILMNQPKYRDYISIATYESTSHTNVNIKMYSHKPKGFSYDCMIFERDDPWHPYFISLPDIPYREPKKDKGKYVTFIVFSSSEVILSGRYVENMATMYNFFVKTVFEHQAQLQETIRAPDRKEIRKVLKLGEGGALPKPRPR